MSKYINHRKVRERIGFIPLFVLIVMFTALISPAPAQAASIAYVLDQANALPDGTDYLRVTLTDTDAGVDFLVETLGALDGITAANFGIQEFGFNFTSNTPYDAITGLPDDWRVANNKQMSEFGRYDIVLKGRGYSRADTLRISILGEDLDLSDFDDFFSAHVAGFDWNTENSGPSAMAQSLNLDGVDVIGRDKKGCYAAGCITSGYFGGGTPAAVPIPAAAWLFGSGLLGLIGAARSKTRAS